MLYILHTTFYMLVIDPISYRGPLESLRQKGVCEIYYPYPPMGFKKNNYHLVLSSLSIIK